MLSGREYRSLLCLKILGLSCGGNGRGSLHLGRSSIDNFFLKQGLRQHPVFCFCQKHPVVHLPSDEMRRPPLPPQILHLDIVVSWS
jgi:hypothetical protein